MDIIRLHCWLVTITVTALHFSSHAYFSAYRAQQCYAGDNKEQAKGTLATAIACNTNNWRALCNLGTIVFNEQEYAEAIKHFDKALEINPQCQEARERRDHAKKILEDREKQDQKEKKDKDDKQKKQDQQNEQDQQEKQDQQDKQSEQNTQENKQDEDKNQSDSKNQPQEGNKQGPAEQEQQAQKPELDQQNKNAKDKPDTKQQQEQRGTGSEQENQTGKQTEHNASRQAQQEEQHGKNSQPQQHTEKPEKLKDGWDDIPLTKREKEIVALVEDTDKAAQQYMMMCTRKAGQHGSQKDW